MTNPLQQLAQHGQSFWYDNISRSLIESGELARLIKEDGLRGITSNPTIFEKAISGGSDYDAQFAELLKQGKDIQQIYDQMTMMDITKAADLLRPVFDQSKGEDGYVSLEVSPLLAYNTEHTMTEARRLFTALNRPNVMIKVPGTLEGVTAFEQLTSEGININVTLIFSLERYKEVANAYLSGLEKWIQKGGDPKKVSSVASVFVSRFDALVDSKLKEGSPLASKAGIANSQLIYAACQEIIASDRFKVLAAKGARVQRPLWASTSTKNRRLPDVLYVEALIGRDTVDTLPAVTVNAFRNHGTVNVALPVNAAGPRKYFEELAKAGVNFAAVSIQLEKEGVDSFAKSFDSLMKTLAEKREKLLIAQK